MEQSKNTTKNKISQRHLARQDDRINIHLKTNRYNEITFFKKEITIVIIL